jgi:hypothetical protein
MKTDKRLRAIWRRGVPLRDAWLEFADPTRKQLYFDLESEGLHLELERTLKDDLMDRLYADQLRAIGVEGVSESGPIYIPQHYFLKTAKINWDKDAVASLDKEFYNVKVQSEREQSAEVSAEPIERSSPICPATVGELAANNERRKGPGRRSVVPEVREVVRELKAGRQFAGLTKGEIERLVAAEARKRFPESFPKPTQPSRNTVYRALAAEGWPPGSQSS